MAVSKRIRYEVLRRDNHTCRYCGDSAPNVTLQVDHVIPSALGGSDKPDNLVAACKDCNAGKSSASAADTVVADVDEKAIAMSNAFRAALKASSGEIMEDRRWCEFVADWWIESAELHGQSFAAMEPGWESGVSYWRRLGVPSNIITDAIDKSMARPGVAQRGRYKYMCGIVWTTIREASEKAVGTTVSAAPADRCGHCEPCIVSAGTGGDWPCAVTRDLEADEEPYLCETCGRSDCYYPLGVEAGMEHEWFKNRDAIIHYRTCPEVVRHG